MAQVRLHGLRKSFGRGGVVAVRDLDLEVQPGELLTIVGPSGCGKTTLLRLIAGLERLDAGTVALDGRDITSATPAARDVAMVFQDASLYPHMTVGKNLAFPLKTRKVARNEIGRRVEDAAELVGVSALLERMPGELSGGERQRAALARTIVLRPKVFLFDEPLSNLDAPQRARLRAHIKSLHRRLGATIIHVTHDQEEAMALGDRMAVMAAGAIQQIGPPLEVFNCPANRFVAKFLGQPPMNFLQGGVSMYEGESIFADANTLRIPVSCTAITAGPAVLGVRPEALRLRPTDGPLDPAALAATITSIERLPDRVIATASTASGEVITFRPALAEAVALREAQSVVLGLSPDAIHLFEPGPFGRRLGP